jgi:hypothetical protein
MARHPANKPASHHIDMRIYFCCQHVEVGDVSTAFTPTPDMVDDLMTKETQRLTHERHSARFWQPARPHSSRTHCARAGVVSLYLSPFFFLLALFFLFFFFLRPVHSRGGDIYTEFPGYLVLILNSQAF